jgi:hypothetical protein
MGSASNAFQPLSYSIGDVMENVVDLRTDNVMTRFKGGGAVEQPLYYALCS